MAIADIMIRMVGFERMDVSQFESDRAEFESHTSAVHGQLAFLSSVTDPQSNVSNERTSDLDRKFNALDANLERVASPGPAHHEIVTAIRVEPGDRLDCQHAKIEERTGQGTELSKKVSDSNEEIDDMIEPSARDAGKAAMDPRRRSLRF